MSNCYRRDWILDTDDGHRLFYKMDYRYKRRIIKVGPFSLWESIRVIQKSTEDPVEFMYHRAVGKTDNSSILYYEILNKIFRKQFDVPEVRNSKYVDKYPFIGDLFKEVVRNRKLEQLGI